MKATGFLSFLMLLLSVVTTQTLAAAPRHVVPSRVPREARAHPLKQLEPAKILEISIGLPLRNQEALTNLLARIYDPATPAYHQYLTSAQFTERFGPSRKDYQELTAWARSKGLKIRATHSNRMLLDLDGSVTVIEKAFNVRIQVYQHPKEHRTFYAPDTDPSLDLAVRVLGIEGLNDFVLPRPMDLHTAFSDPVTYSTPYATGSGPNGTFIGRDFRAAYAPGVALDGTGQAIGLFELDGYYPSDITVYKDLAGLPDVPVTNVLVSGFTGRPGANNIEVALDIEMAIAMAPGLSQVIVYEGRGLNANSVLNRMATDNLAKQLSSSWGFGPQIDPVRQQIFQQFAAQGQSLFQASGDLGAWNGPIFPPSDDPYLTVVGGTSLTTTGAGGDWLSETTWPGSGGGISTSNALPAWQKSISTLANGGSPTMRNIPDVACLADVTMWIVCNNGQQGRVGGTSAAAPLWAGFAALANQQADAAAIPSIGFLNPALYALGSSSSYLTALHDITTGNNTNNVSPTNFFAVPGYDLCTGWGTPNGSNLIAALLAPPDALRISPGTPTSFTGPVGGPFLPTPQTYSLTNCSATPLSWTLAAVPQWLEVSPSSGNLVPGGPSATVLLRLTPAVTNFDAGIYTTQLWFTNLNDNFAQNRPISLNVVTPPTITAQPADQAVYETAMATFHVGTESNASLSYQWQFDNGSYLTNLEDDENVSGATTATLTVRAASATNVGAYSVIVTNAAGALSSLSAFLTIVPWRPVIITPPLSQPALPGSTVILNVAAVGTQPLFFHWLKDGTYLSDGGHLSGSASSSLTISNVSQADAGAYTVIIANALGWILSPEATVTVLPVTTPGIALSSFYSFTGDFDGAHPNGLVQASNGLFYGTTQMGGTTSSGTLFQMTAAGVVTSLHSFDGSDGANPRSPLIQSADGNLYGTAYQAGTNGFGTIFRATPSGGVSALFSFDKPEGILPYAGVLQSSDGTLYGTAYEGGTNILYGTVYTVAPNGISTTLHHFTGGGDGGFAYSGLARGTDGNFYGTTYSGGAKGFGTLYKITTNGVLTTLVSFNNTNGAFPYAGLVQSLDGCFYGATANGGASSNGTLFRINAEGELTTLHSFAGADDGANPAATLLEGSDGNLYGSTANGGACGKGTVFRLSPNGAFTTLAQFDGYNGAHPIAPLAQGADGSLYGVTQNGGATDNGTIFQVRSTSAPQITGQPASQSVFVGAAVRLAVAVTGAEPLHYQWSKNGTNVADSQAVTGATGRVLTLSNVSLNDSGIYSVLVSNALGWAQSAEAIVQVSSSPPLIVQQPTNQTVAPGTTVTFSIRAIGNLPLSFQWRKNGTNLADTAHLYGVASTALTINISTEADNGLYSVAVSNALGSQTSVEAELLVVPASAAGTRLKTLRCFSGGADGLNPNGLTRGADGIVYGTTEYGGARLLGTLFRVDTNAVVTTLNSFNSTNGIRPKGVLAQGREGALYGITWSGGSYDAGAVFEMTSEGTVAPVYSFTDLADGSQPAVGLTPGLDGNFYGSTTSGGDSGYGNLFKITPDGALTVLYNFTNGVDGSAPSGELLQATDGNFYGMTPGGGASANGSIFRVTPAGAFTNIYSFTGGADGYQPVGALIQGTDGNLYGTTKFNKMAGYTFYGTIFKVTTNGVLTTLYPLNYGDGTYPAAGLFQAADGNLYGTTYQGGANDFGTIFRITPAGTLTTLVDFDGFDDGARPASALVAGAEGSLYGTTTQGGPGGHGTVFKLSFAPNILSHPGNLEVSAGTNISFGASVFGTEPLFYQWLQNGTNLADGPNLSGSATPVLTLNNVSAANAGTYALIVTNFLGAATNTGPVLTVIAPLVFQAVWRTNDVLVLNWNGILGRAYQLQYRNDLSATNWTNLGAPIPAGNTTVSTTDMIGASPRRFYRVVLLP